jgi:hypothetical protein
VDPNNNFFDGYRSPDVPTDSEEDDNDNLISQSDIHQNNVDSQQSNFEVMDFQQSNLDLQQYNMEFTNFQQNNMNSQQNNVDSQEINVDSQQSNLDNDIESQTIVLNNLKKKTKRCNIPPRPTWKKKARKKKTTATLYNFASATFGTTTPEQIEPIIVNKESRIMNEKPIIQEDVAQITPISRRQQKRSKRIHSLPTIEVIL